MTIKAINLTKGTTTDRGTVTYVEVTHRNVYVRFDNVSRLHMMNHTTALRLV